MNMPVYEVGTVQEYMNARDGRSCITRERSLVDFMDNIEKRFEWVGKALIYNGGGENTSIPEEYKKIFTDVIVIVETDGQFSTWGRYVS